MDSSAFNHIGDAVSLFARVALILLAIFIPLGLWKLVEIVLWVFSHVSITVGAA